MLSRLQEEPRPMSEPSKPWPAMSIAEANRIITSPGMPCEMEELVIRGVPTRVWKNLPPSLRSVAEASRAHGEKIFLEHEDERGSFEGFLHDVAALDAQ